MKDVKIRRAVLEDKEALMDYFKHYDVPRLIEKRINCYLIHNETMIAKKNEEIIGTLQWQVKEDPNLGVVEFEEIFVKKEYRRKGIGSSLLDYAIDAVLVHFKHLKIEPRRIFLFVNERNKGARKMYEKCGFKCMANVGNLFSDKADELFYVLVL